MTQDIIRICNETLCAVLLRTKGAWIYQRGARSTKAVLLRQVVNLTCVTATRTVSFAKREWYTTWVRCSLRRVCICNVDEKASLLRAADDLLRIMARGALFLEHFDVAPGYRVVCMVVDIVNYLTRWTINNSHWREVFGMELTWKNDERY